MASVDYRYSIVRDFPNHKVDTSRLSDEIRASEIVSALDYILTDGDTCLIWFKTSLSTHDVFVLNALVAAHSGEPIPEPIQQVTLAGPGSLDGKPYIVPNLLPEDTSLYYFGAGDSPSEVAAGTPFTHASDVEGDYDVDWVFSDIVWLIGGYIIYQGAKLGDWLDYRVYAPATLTGVGDTGVALAAIPGGNLIVPYPGGPTTIELSQAVLLPGDNGFWDWDEPSTGKGTITPNYERTGKYNLVDFEVKLGNPAAKLHMLGTGHIDFAMPNTSPMRAIPGWRHTAKIHNIGHTGLELTWAFTAGRGGAV